MKKTRRELFTEIRALTSYKESVALKIKDFLKERGENESKRRELISNITDLTKNLDQEKDSKKIILEEGNKRAEFIRDILKIVLGEAQPVSKYEIIRDKFLDQIKEMEDQNNLEEAHKRIERRSHKLSVPYLTEDIQDHESNLYFDHRRNY